MQKNRIYESMTRIQLFGFTIRVWMTEKALFQGPRTEVVVAVKNELKDKGWACTLDRIAEVLDQFPDVSAYEILDANGNGAIVYPDWP